jgi:hypothetical protein
MRRHCLMLTLLCLSAPRAAGAEGTGFPPWPECYEGITSESVARKREAFRNPDKLKAELLRFLPINGRFDFTEFPWFKKTFDVQDEVLRPVLLEIYREASLKDLADPRNHLDRLRALRSLTGLGICADDDTKQLLLGLAAEASDVRGMRMRSLAAYLQAADPEETKNALLRFLVEGDRMDYMERLSIYEYARMIFESADEQKRAAVLHALYIAVSGSDLAPWEFRVADKILVKLSPLYARSTQRFELLKKHTAASYPKIRERTKNELTDQFEKMRNFKEFTAISTNIAALKARDFNLPLPDSETNEYTNVVPDSAGHGPRKERRGGAGRQAGMVALLGGIAAVLLGYGLWRIVRK